MTFLSRFFLICFSVLLTQAGPVLAQDSGNSPQKLALAKEYVALMGIENEVRRAVGEAAEEFAPEDRVLFRSLAEKSVDYARLRTAAEINSAEIFTEDELRGMIAFYKTDIGKAVQKKTPLYESRMQPVMVEVMSPFFARLQENGLSPRPGE